MYCNFAGQTTLSTISRFFSFLNKSPFTLLNTLIAVNWSWMNVRGEEEHPQFYTESAEDMM